MCCQGLILIKCGAQHASPPPALESMSISLRARMLTLCLWEPTLLDEGESFTQMNLCLT